MFVSTMQPSANTESRKKPSGVVVRPVATRRELHTFVDFPWRIYRNDPYWVPPLRSARRHKLDPRKDPFWRNAERELFIAWRGHEPVGTIAAIVDYGRMQVSKTRDGVFGFFECIDDDAVACALIDQARTWLRARGMTGIVGPYSPSVADEHGVLLEGHTTRPSLMEAHTPVYYSRLLEAAGLVTFRHSFAWLVQAEEGRRDLTRLLPPVLFEAAERARRQPGVRTRPVDPSRWNEEVKLVHQLYNRAMATVPDFVPIPEADFFAIAENFRRILMPELVRIAEVDGKPVAYALALPDVNEALQTIDGRWFPFGALRFWWRCRKLTRATFKILVVLPEYRRRGIEALLIAETAQAMLDAGFREADLSHTGEENTRINFYLQTLGLKIYRRYRIYRGEL